MLVLSRFINEEVVFVLNGKEFGSASVVRVRGDKVGIGVKMPADVEVHRREVWDRILQERGGITSIDAIRRETAAKRRRGGLEV